MAPDPRGVRDRRRADRDAGPPRRDGATARLARERAAIVTMIESEEATRAPKGMRRLDWSYEVTCSRATDVVAPREALASNKPPLLAPQGALRSGKIAEVLRYSHPSRPRRRGGD